MIFCKQKKIFFFKQANLLGLLFLCLGGLTSAEYVSAEQNTCSINWNLFTCQPANFSPPGKTAIEIAEEKRIAFLRSEAIRRANAWPTAFVKITKNMKNPNSVKIPFAQAPGISADTREENGRRVCEKKKDKGKKSKQDGKDVHIDRECCLDPDEIPNPRCYYPQLGANNSPERVTGPDGKKYIK